MARSLAMLLRPSRAPSGVPPAEGCLEAVRTVRGEYRLRGGLAREGTLSPASSLVIVGIEGCSGPVGLSDEELREHFGLTRKEVEVARLIALGHTNQQIAERLFISPFTARNHTERLMGKLRVSSRARVGAILAGHPDEAPRRGR